MRFLNPARIALFGLIVSLSALAAHAQGFSAPKNLSNSPGSSSEPRIAVDGRGNINIVWNDNSSGAFDIFFTRSSNLGTTFSAPHNISNNSGGSFIPQMALDGNGNIYVVWTDNTAGNDEILFSHSVDGGATFSPPKNISNNNGNSFNTQIAVDTGGNVNVVWEDSTPGNLDIFFARSTDGGISFSAPQDISNNVGNSEIPQIGVDHSGDINVVWQDDTPGNLDVFFSRSTNGGASFSAPTDLSNNSGASIFPEIAVDDVGNINIVWEDTTALNSGTLFTRSTNGGATFSPLQNLSGNTGISQFPRIAVDSGGKINVVWENNAPGNFDIFFSRSADSGANFSAPKNLSNSTGISHLPQMALDSNGNINVVFSDTTPGNLDVFFTQFVVDDDSLFSQLNGGNTFNGNQIVNGAITASGFIGTATNALSLGGVAANNYARVDIGNNFTGNQAVTGNVSASGNLSATGSATLGGPVTIGGGTGIKEHLSQTFSVSVGVINPTACAALMNFALTGASDGDSLALGVPNSLMAAGSGILNFTAWVSAPSTITIRVCNLNPNGPKSSTVSGTIRVDLWKH